MKIDLFHAAADRFAGEIVAAALVRSFSTAQVNVVGQATGAAAGAAVWINPPEDMCLDLRRLVSSGGKALVLGRIGPRVAATLGLEHLGQLAWPAAWGRCTPHAETPYDVSTAAVRYVDRHPLARQSPLGVRPLCRFDFADEWNNLGFGRIGTSGDPWSLQSAVETGGRQALAHLVTPGGERLLYAALAESPVGAALWFNRPVGPVDSLEWRVVDSFLGDYRPDELPCYPYLGEVPASYDGVACARLDCDEAVASARPLVELYRDHGAPLSLAVLTGQPLDSTDVQLMRDVIAGGGSVVSHSQSHAPNWGGSHQRATEEATASRAWLEANLPEAAPVRYAVSPFHQNPTYAVAALSDAGYQGFMAGIIANDPEYLLGRAGRVPFASRPIVSLSTQCMLHGDCYRRAGNSIGVYLDNFATHRAAGAIFGYLDHPFSARYQYGWEDEPARVEVHRQLIDAISQHPNTWWASIGQVLDFLGRRDAALVAATSTSTLTVDVPERGACPPLAIHWKGERRAE